MIEVGTEVEAVGFIAKNQSRDGKGFVTDILDPSKNRGSTLLFVGKTEVFSSINWKQKPALLVPFSCARLTSRVICGNNRNK